jgi:hypothetical protein
MMSVKYKCTYLDTAWVQENLREIAVQQMGSLLKKTNPSSRLSGNNISEVIKQKLIMLVKASSNIPDWPPRYWIGFKVRG